MTYIVEVVETTERRFCYTVEAKDRDTAIELAESGDGEDEEPLSDDGEVVSRKAIKARRRR